MSATTTATKSNESKYEPMPAKLEITSAIASLIQKGKSAAGRLKTMHGDSFDILAVKVGVSGKGDSAKVSGVSFGSKRMSDTACASAGLSVGDAQVLPAYQALVTLSRYLEVSVDKLAIISE